MTDKPGEWPYGMSVTEMLYSMVDQAEHLAKSDPRFKKLAKRVKRLAEEYDNS